MEQRAYSYEELGELKRQILDICERVRADNPKAWAAAHNGNFDDTSTRFNDLCVQALRAAGIYAGCNGKRGGSQRSDDILDFGLTDGRGAQDTSGRFPSIAIIDYINGAGGPNASIGWGDVSASAPGRFLDPQGLPRVDGGGGGVTVPPTEPPSPPVVVRPPTQPDVNEVRFRTIESKLDAALATISDLQNSQAQKPSLGEIRQAMNELVLGPEVMGFVRVDLNELRGELEALTKWLRSRRALGF